MRTARPQPSGFAAKAKDLQALREAVDQAATVSGGLWLSYIFVFLYLAIAAGAVTHKDLFFENPVKLPFLNVELPLVGFFTLGPALFLIVHAYTLLHFAMLAGKVRAFHTELEATVPLHLSREDLRRQLPSNIFVQFLAGPRNVRSGIMGFMLRLIAWISLIIGPVALLVFFELQFLPYHDPVVTWWHRIAVVIDLLLLWVLWPRIAPIMATGLLRRLYRASLRATGLTALTLLSLLLVTIATFPGERLHDIIPQGPSFVPESFAVIAEDWWVKIRRGQLHDICWPDEKTLTLHQFLVGGEVDDVAQRQKSWWSNRLVLPGIDLREHPKFDTKEKIETRPTTLRMRGRRLENAILQDAHLPKADFTGGALKGARMHSAQLEGAILDFTELQGAWLGSARLQGAHLNGAKLQGAILELAQLQDAWLPGAQLQGARLDQAQLQGARLNKAELQGASLVEAQLQGATLYETRLRGAWLSLAELQGANLTEAQLQVAWLDGAQLQGASLDGAQLQGASLYMAELQGVSLDGTELLGASLDNVFVWRADPSTADVEGAYVKNADGKPRYRRLDCRSRESCPWSSKSYVELRRLIQEKVPPGNRQKAAFDRIAPLDPDKEIADSSGLWGRLEEQHSNLGEYRKNLSAIFQNSGCDTNGAPFVVKSLAAQMEDRFRDDSIRASELASVFLNEDKCPGARGLPKKDQERLRKIHDRVPPTPIAREPGVKAAE